jgi:sugar phosphate isomerase/epimerase
MAGRLFSRKGGLAGCVLGISVVLLCVGCASTAKKRQIAFKKYDNLKLGFTTKNFLDFVDVDVESTKKLIDYASEKGFCWIELRDANAVLKLSECEEIADYARSRNIEVGYAIHKGLLDYDFWQKYNRGLENAAVFDGPRTLRAVACGNKFIYDANKKGWRIDELKRLVRTANRAAQMAEKRGLKLVVENGFEALRGDGVTYFGLTEFFVNADPAVGWQFDTANFFSGSRVRTKPEDAKAFLEGNAHKIGYIHLKTSRDGLAQPVLGDNELDFDIIFSSLSKHNVPYVAVELHGGKDIGEVYANHDKSIEYLQRRGFISVK